jgi:hypothetical protein
LKNSVILSIYNTDYYYFIFSFGFLQNFIDLIDTKILCLKPTMVNWKREHDIQDVLNSRLDKKKEKGSFDV